MKFMSNYKTYYLVYGIFNKFLVKIRSLTTLTEKNNQMNSEFFNNVSSILLRLHSAAYASMAKS